MKLEHMPTDFWYAVPAVRFPGPKRARIGAAYGPANGARRVPMERLKGPFWSVARRTTSLTASRRTVTRRPLGLRRSRLLEYARHRTAIHEQEG
jgi:hypothetical protein